MCYDKRIPKTADPAKRIAMMMLAKKSIFSPPRRVKWLIFDALPPKADPSIPSPARWKIMTNTKRIAKAS